MELIQNFTCQRDGNEFTLYKAGVSVLTSGGHGICLSDQPFWVAQKTNHENCEKYDIWCIVSGRIVSVSVPTVLSARSIAKIARGHSLELTEEGLDFLICYLEASCEQIGNFMSPF